MKILVVGGGGREHTIIKKIKENPAVETIYALPGNGGIAADAVCVNIGAKDIDGIVKFAAENKIDYAIVAPDDPLALGAVDALNAIGIPAFGPDKKAAVIESSKVFSKNLMKKYGIPTAAYEVFDKAEDAKAYVEKCKIPVVIKADGLALGKGVIIAMERSQLNFRMQTFHSLRQYVGASMPISFAIFFIFESVQFFFRHFKSLLYKFHNQHCERKIKNSYPSQKGRSYPRFHPHWFLRNPLGTVNAGIRTGILTEAFRSQFEGGASIVLPYCSQPRQYFL